MATNYSNEIKALVIQENFLENPMNVMKEICLTIQRFDYQCEHKRNDSGEVYGATEPVILDFSIRVNSPRHSRPYYSALVSNERFRYSFLFNATFGPTERLADYEDGMVIEGYVVHVEEDYVTKAAADGADRQILLNVKLQVCSVTYLGRENHLTNTFIQ